MIKKKLKRFFRKNFYILTVIVFISSCIPAKKVKYLQSTSPNETNSFKTKDVEYKLQAGDNLSISLTSTDMETNIALNTQVQSNQLQGAAQKYKDIYLIDNKGYIKHTQLEKIYVEGLSLQQAKDTIEAKISVFYKQVTANVRLADNYITILGEVGSPGRYLIDFDDKISIFALIGEAGDLKIEANRNNIKLIRKVGDNTEIFHIDITKKNIIENDFYYLMPNDIVYVEPLNVTFWGPRNFPFVTTVSLILSTATSIFVFFNYFK